MNIGGSEFLLIALLALLLFGPSLLAFWFGYILGQRKGEETSSEPPDAASEDSNPPEAEPHDEAQTHPALDEEETDD